MSQRSSKTPRAFAEPRICTRPLMNSCGVSSWLSSTSMVSKRKPSSSASRHVKSSPSSMPCSSLRVLGCMMPWTNSSLLSMPSLFVSDRLYTSASFSTMWCNCAWFFLIMSARCSIASLSVCSTITAKTVFMIENVVTIKKPTMTKLMYHWSVSHTIRVMSGQPSRVAIWKRVNMAPGKVPKNSCRATLWVSLPSSLTKMMPKT
mmetsp:Transcript_89170/g.236996  ORF Transcript_89170/g.236996 Transcript_89170/m.236996 type:complete len:204 (-) Transcript_89170:818-1429(-)